MANRKIKWPNGKKSAGMVTVEIDGELMWLLLDPTNINRPKTLSMGTYGLYRGLARMLGVLSEKEITATFFVPGLMAEKCPDSIKMICSKGHEIALHGYKHENFGLMSPEEQKDAVAKGIGAIENTVGVKPKGFRLPEGNMTPATLSILNDAGFDYDCSMLDDDIPYQTVIDDSPVPMVEIPMHWEMQDFPYFAFNFFPPFPLGECRIANYDSVSEIWEKELDGYDEFGLCYVIKFDPQTIGSPGKIVMFEEILDKMKAKNMWIATGREISDYYRKEYMDD